MESSVAFLGCSRGLGAEVLRIYSSLHGDEAGMLVARSGQRLESLSHEVEMQTEWDTVDFANPSATEAWFGAFLTGPVKRIFYFAGGGPHGLYGSKNWRDHMWAWHVNLLTPAFLIHRALKNSAQSQLEQVIVVGSCVADSQGDPLASSYSSSKHGLRGLVESVQLENPEIDIRLFRPGYMNTAMLPPKALPRVQFQVLQDPVSMAKRFVTWADDPEGQKILTP